MFALVVGGLCTGSLGRRFKASSSRNGSRRDVCVLKSKACGCYSSHLLNVFWKGLKKIPWLQVIVGKVNTQNSLKLTEIHVSSFGFQPIPLCFKASTIKSDFREHSCEQ